jgi:hypothetical protein
MAVTATPIFVQALKRGFANPTTTDSGMINPTTAQLTVLTAGTNGSKVFEITVEQSQTTGVASIVRIFAGASSTTGKLIDEIVKTSITASATVAGFRVTRVYDNLLLAASELLIATVSATDNVSVTAYYGDY